MVKVTRNYQETIPAGIRERLEIKVGDLLSVEIDGDRIILRTVVQEIPIIRLDGELTINDIEGFIEEGLMKNV
ncbi:AbrB/MazE/SpoVT family DNA-binding domain-containing protein [Vulcanisaeta souniana]|uniref:AbrB family transcriptional regulator n=1 Tax=Vulcanisaeta souniana JCM 11219 TaxID=1293586 RepID=A0A830E910_9CREN|nr:AbrB family transcriptional regulator [Vulcanisaeta souniana JCM 11219]GGI81573.1 AbrB family transcriptional regulator [Vulcanisaeta souniana JCM 11219]